jgi:hypothetical protein
MAPHYEFFQRTTVHVNSQVLLSSAHPALGGSRGFLGRYFHLERSSATRITIPGAGEEDGEGCVEKNP